MITESKAQDILFASVYFREIFKRTLFEATPDSVTTKTQMNILVTLFAHKPMNIGELSKVTGVARAQIARAVKVLREKELVKYEKRPENRREVIIQLSDQGRNAIQRQLNEAEKYLAEYLENLNQTDVDALATISVKAIRILEKTNTKTIVPSSSKTDCPMPENRPYDGRTESEQKNIK